jgi:hydrogenase-4 membrane subunit HyfE
MTPELLIVLAGATLIVNGRTSQALIAYVVLAATTSIILLPSSLATPTALALFSLSTILKVGLAPIALRWFLRANPAADNLSPSVSAMLRLAFVILIAYAATTVARDSAFAGIPMIGTAVFTVLCGIGMLMVHRNLLAHVFGLLVLGAGVELAGAMIAPGLPASFELGATFDVLVVTFIGLALVRAIATHNPLLDVESLRRLRG